MKKLPKTVCVRWEEMDNEDYLIASHDIDGMVKEIGDSYTVGVYKLIETKTIKGVWEVSDKKTVS